MRPLITACRTGTAKQQQAALQSILHWAIAREAAAQAALTSAPGWQLARPQPLQQLAQSSGQPGLAAAVVAALPLAASPAEKHEAHATVVASATVAAEVDLQGYPTPQQIPAGDSSLPAGVGAGTMWQHPTPGSLPAAGHQMLGLISTAEASGSAVAGSAVETAAVGGGPCWSQADCDVRAVVWGMLHMLQCGPGSCHALAAETLCRLVGYQGFDGVVIACMGHPVCSCSEVHSAVEAVYGQSLAQAVRSALHQEATVAASAEFAA